MDEVGGACSGSLAFKGKGTETIHSEQNAVVKPMVHV